MIPTLLLAAAQAADPKPADTAKADEMIHRYLVAETKKLSEKFMDGAKTKAEWEAKRPRLKQEFLDMLGLWPLPEKTDLKATVTGTLDRGGVVIEKLHYQSRPGLYVTGNLYRPKANDKKLPAILYVCGHSGRGRDGNKTAFQDHGLWFASNGYVCLTVDTLQLGEVAGIHHGTYREGRWWWHSRGYTPAGVECWNGVRGIDYLLSRPDVDPDRIGVTGISGGGATTVWVAAADDRVKVAVPVSGMSDLESYVSNKVINGHCDCMFFVNTYQWEWTTALALHAPKPLLFANSDNDTIFPMDGNRRIMARLRQCYGMLGEADNVDEYVSKGGHEDRPDLRVAAFRFMNKHLKGESGEVKPAGLAPVVGKELRVFPEDKDLPKDAINARVDEVFVPKADVKLPAKPEDFAAWKAGLVKRLREVSFRTIKAGKRDAESNRSRPDLPRLRTTLKSADGEVKAVTLVVLNSDEDDEEARKIWNSRFPTDDIQRGNYTRNGGPFRWTRKNPPNTVERSLALLGETVDSGRLQDVVEDAAYYSDFGGKYRMAGRGQAGVLAAYAALFEPSIKEVVIVDPPTSHRDGPHFLNVERVLDLPTALGLLAPDVTLTLVNAKDQAFDKTAALYKLAGAEGKFKRE
jgi:cephalosporin-C deacetylase-like acetyl esterase